MTETRKSALKLWQQIEHKIHSINAVASHELDSRRLFHGRGKTLEDLSFVNVDFFHPCLVFVFYDDPGEVFFEELKALLEQEAVTAKSLEADSQDGVVSRAIQSIFFQHRYLRHSPFDCVIGKPEKLQYAQREGLKFKLSSEQQNIGFFLDIEPARVALEHILRQQVAKGKSPSVLNLFAYTCAFSVVAAAAGADKIVNIDMSKRSLSVGRENHKLNQLSCERHKFLGHDIFKSWGKLKREGPYDLVILDPPSFQKGSFVARKDYQKLLRKMDELVKPEGSFIACLNAPEISISEFEAWLDEFSPEFGDRNILEGNADFPELDGKPALKMVVARR